MFKKFCFIACIFCIFCFAVLAAFAESNSSGRTDDIDFSKVLEQGRHNEFLDTKVKKLMKDHWPSVNYTGDHSQEDDSDNEGGEKTIIVKQEPVDLSDIYHRLDAIDDRLNSLSKKLNDVSNAKPKVEYVYVPQVVEESKEKTNEVTVVKEVVKEEAKQKEVEKVKTDTAPKKPHIAKADKTKSFDYVEVEEGVETEEDYKEYKIKERKQKQPKTIRIKRNKHKIELEKTSPCLGLLVSYQFIPDKKWAAEMEPLIGGELCYEFPEIKDKSCFFGLSIGLDFYYNLIKGKGAYDFYHHAFGASMPFIMNFHITQDQTLCLGVGPFAEYDVLSIAEYYKTTITNFKQQQYGTLLQLHHKFKIGKNAQTMFGVRGYIPKTTQSFNYVNVDAGVMFKI